MRKTILLAGLLLVAAQAQQYPPANPPDYQPPPLPTLRGGEIKDPQTGIVYKRVTLPGDVGDATFWSAGKHGWYSAGNFRACSEWTLADGGHLCAVPSAGGGPAVMYWIQKDTGDVQFRGVMWMPASSDPQYGWSYVGMEGGIPTDPMQPGVFWQTRGGWLMRGVYQDPGKEVPQNTAASFTWTKFVELKNTYSTQYPGKMGPGGLTYINGDLFVMQDRMYWQDSPGVVSVYSLAQKKFIGRVESWSDPSCRWCGLHSAPPIRTSFPAVNMVVQTLCGGAATGPYSVKLIKAVTAADTVFEVDGEPQNEDLVNGPRQLQTAEVGDIAGVNGCHGSEQERMKITAKSISPTGTVIWTVARGSPAKGWPVDTRLVMQPGSLSSEYWFDPATNKLYSDPNRGGAHRATYEPWDIDAEYSIRTFSSMEDLITKPWDFKCPWVIAGTGTGFNFPNHQRHPSLHAASNRMFDIMPVYWYDQDKNMPNKGPQMGALLEWDLTDPSCKSVNVLSHLLSAPHLMSIYANIHLASTGNWGLTELANQEMVAVVMLPTDGSPPPPPPPTIAWRLVSGALPEGLALSVDGRITGTATGAPGVYTFDVEASVPDGSAQPVRSTHIITVTEPPPPPPLPPQPPPPPAKIIVTSPADLGRVERGQPFSYQLQGQIA